MKDEFVSLLKELPVGLKMIIDSEVLADNPVVKVDRFWPQSGNLNVLLQKPFQSRHSGVENVQYARDSDMHHPIEMYLDPRSGDCVFCSLI